MSLRDVMELPFAYVLAVEVRLTLLVDVRLIMLVVVRLLCWFTLG